MSDLLVEWALVCLVVVLVVLGHTCWRLRVRLQEAEKRQGLVYTKLVGVILAGGTRNKPYPPGHYRVSSVIDTTTGVEYLTATQEAR